LNEQNKPTSIADDIVVSLDYTLTVDGEVVDTSSDSEPIQFIQGHGNIIPGLERELYGMEVQDNKTVHVVAKDAYGLSDPDAIVEVALSEFSPEIPLRPGVELQMRNEDGEVLFATIVNVGSATVRLDFNHPLAGKDLTFDVTVVDLRQPTAEELEHGHVHGDMEEDEDLEYDFDEGDDDEAEEE
jgi:FKBP-type peptidyl-prolyl cis-trans isomerase SlyD